MKNYNINPIHLFLVGVLSTFLVGCTGNSEETTEINVDEVQRKNTKVSIAQAKKTTFEHFFEIQGAIEADQNVIVLPEAGGIVKQILVKEGQMVNKGDVLVNLDSKVVNASKQEVQEQLELAKFMYDKQKMLYEKEIGTEVELKQAETQYKALEKTLETLSAQQSMYQINAPFSGYIEEVFTTEGSMVGPMNPIIRLIGLDKLSVKADISEVYVKNVDKSSIANLSFPAIDVELKNIPVTRIGKFVNEANRTVVLKIDIPSPTDKMIPNMMAVVKLRDYYDTSAVVIPSRTILRDINQEPYVFVVKNNKVYQTPIKTGPTSDGVTKVIEGLAEGEMIVDKGARGVKDGQEVIIQ